MEAMYQSPEETIPSAGSVAFDAARHATLPWQVRELLRDDLDFIPDDPAELRRAVTRMAAHINHADWRFIKLIAAMDRTRGWAEAGYASLGNWLDHRCGLGPCAARERIRIGRALARLPQIDAAFRDGVLSYSKVRAITRVATHGNEAVLLDIAGSSSAAQLESLVRTHQRIGGDERERVCSEERRGLTWHYEDGMVVITAAVPAERGALVIRALEKVLDGWKDEREAYYEGLLEGKPDPGPTEPEAAEPEEAPYGPVDVSAETERPAAGACEHEPPAIDLPAGLEFELSSSEQRHADALVEVAEHYLANGPGRRGRRYEVVLTIGRNELAARTNAGGACYHVDPDWGVDEEDARRVACDADLTEFVQDERGNLLNYERRRRIVPARLLRALKLRDHNRCRFPGCAHQRYVEAHHVEHWIDGGETRLDNLVLLCSAHHRLLHHGAFHIVPEDDGLVFVSRDGEVIEPALRPQFPGVFPSAFPPVFPRKRDRLASGLPPHRVPLEHAREEVDGPFVSPSSTCDATMANLTCARGRLWRGLEPGNPATRSLAGVPCAPAKSKMALGAATGDRRWAESRFRPPSAPAIRPMP